MRGRNLGAVIGERAPASIVARAAGGGSDTRGKKCSPWCALDSNYNLPVKDGTRTSNDTNCRRLQHACVCMHERPALSDDLIRTYISESPGTRGRHRVVRRQTFSRALSPVPIFTITTYVPCIQGTGSVRTTTLSVNIMKFYKSNVYRKMFFILPYIVEHT